MELVVTLTTFMAYFWGSAGSAGEQGRGYNGEIVSGKLLSRTVNGSLAAVGSFSSDKA